MEKDKGWRRERNRKGKGMKEGKEDKRLEKGKGWRRERVGEGKESEKGKG